MRLNARCSSARVVAALIIQVSGCRNGATIAGDEDVGARLSVFVPSEDVTLAKELYGGMTVRERLVIRSASEWPAIWSRIHGSLTPPPDVVQPDFGTEVAVVAAMGEKSTGGFEIVIDSVTRHSRGSIVYITEQGPGSNCMTTQALTQPVHAVRAPRTDGSIWWRERSIGENC